MPYMKSCPFCGSRPRLKIDYRFQKDKAEAGRTTVYAVMCYNIDCIMYHADHIFFKAPSEAIEAWNRRAT